MYIEKVPNRNSPPAVLLRESRREGGRTIKRTIANLSACPPEAVEAFRLALKGIALVPQQSFYHTESSTPHGHVEAILGSISALGLDTILSSRSCPQRDLVLAMITQRLLYPCSKLATTRRWHTTTLAEELKVTDATEDELYAALDWLLARQERIEQKLAKRHLHEGARVLYDVSSSSYTGHSCVLARRGHNRDKTKLPCIVYGLMTDAEGRPIAIDVYKGNTGDPSTIPDQVEKLRGRFHLEHVVLVGDRGMLTNAQITTLKQYPQLGWISALRSKAIAQLIEQEAVQLSIFDQQNLVEISSEQFPGERLMVCYNPLLAEDRARTRSALLDETEKQLRRIAAEVTRRTKTPLTADALGLKVGKVINRHKVGKHFDLKIADGSFSFARKERNIAEEARLDGIYVIRTSEPASRLSSADAVRAYKTLEQVERAFRCLKGIDLRIRPIHHRTETHVKAHVFLCMLAYYVEYHMRKQLAPVLFQDAGLDDRRWSRDPVAKVEPNRETQRKKQTRISAEGYPVHSFDSLLADLGTRCRNVCRAGEGKDVIRFTTITEPTDFQRNVFRLLGVKVP
jgi:transposase